MSPVNRSNRETTFKPSDFLVKTSVTGQTGPVNQSNRPVYRYEPFAQRILNSNLTSTGLDWFPAKPVRYTGTGSRRFGQTGR